MLCCSIPISFVKNPTSSWFIQHFGETYSCISDWWFGTFGLFFHSVGNGIIIPTDFHSIIFQRSRYTTNQLCYGYGMTILVIQIVITQKCLGCLGCLGPAILDHHPDIHNFPKFFPIFPGVNWPLCLSHWIYGRSSVPVARERSSDRRDRGIWDQLDTMNKRCWMMLDVDTMNLEIALE